LFAAGALKGRGSEGKEAEVLSMRNIAWKNISEMQRKRGCILSLLQNRP